MGTWTYAHVHEYLTVRRAASMLLAQGHAVKLSRCGDTYDAEAWERECIRALDRRITLKAGPTSPWRKLAPEWQTNMQRDARALADLLQRRIRRAYRFDTREMQARFGHLLSSHND